MSRFAELTNHPPGSGIQQFQNEARAKLRQLADGKPIRAHDLTSISQNGTYVAIGAASWSNYDLKLLDQVDASAGRGWPPNTTFGLFDFDLIQTVADFEKFVPGIQNVFHSPVVGVWSQGQLLQSASGYEGRKLVERVLEGETRIAQSNMHQTNEAAVTTAV